MLCGNSSQAKLRSLFGSDATLVHLRDLWRVCACAIASTGVFCKTFLSKAFRLSSGCTSVAGVADMLVASGEFSPSVSSRLAPRTHDRPSDLYSEIIGVACRALGGRPGQRLMTTRTRRRENLLNTLWIAPKLRQNRFKYRATPSIGSKKISVGLYVPL